MNIFEFRITYFEAESGSFISSEILKQKADSREGAQDILWEYIEKAIYDYEDEMGVDVDYEETLTNVS